MVVKEFILEATPYQEIMVPIGSRVINAMVKAPGIAVLIVEVEDTAEQTPPGLEPENETVGVYVVQTDDPLAEDIPEDYVYMNSLHMAGSLGVALFHVYVQDSEFYLAGAEQTFTDQDFFEGGLV